jgi:hypothetical protein
MDEKEEYLHKEQFSWMKMNHQFIETRHTKVYWAAIDGVYAADQDLDEEPEGHRHIVFVGGQMELLVYKYTPELWKRIQEFQPEWTTGPAVMEGFSCASIWRKADHITHSSTYIDVHVRDVSTPCLNTVLELSIGCAHSCQNCAQ